MRERALRLVHTKLKTNTTDLLNREAQAQVAIIIGTAVQSQIIFSADCRDKEGFRLGDCHWRRVPQTDGHPQHDLFAQVHGRTGW